MYTHTFLELSYIAHQTHLGPSLPHIPIFEAGSTCKAFLLPVSMLRSNGLTCLKNKTKLKYQTDFLLRLATILVVWQWLPKYHAKKVIKASASSDCLDLDFGHETNQSNLVKASFVMNQIHYLFNGVKAQTICQEVHVLTKDKKPTKVIKEFTLSFQRGQTNCMVTAIKERPRSRQRQGTEACSTPV